ncbi:membrane protein [Escherichia coli O174:H8 str. 04-3038]|nr:membrane protein [Escherichia coli O174:H8 str. 04-3038]
MQTKNLPLTNSLLQNDYAESIFVFNGERDVSEMLLTGNAESER